MIRPINQPTNLTTNLPAYLYNTEKAKCRCIDHGNEVKSNLGHNVALQTELDLLDTPVMTLKGIIQAVSHNS